MKRQIKRGLLKTLLVLIYGLLGGLAGAFVGVRLLADDAMGGSSLAAWLTGAFVGTLIGVIVGGLFAFSRRGRAAMKRSRRALGVGAFLLVLILVAIGIWRLATPDGAEPEEVQTVVPEPAPAATPDTSAVDSVD